MDTHLRRLAARQSDVVARWQLLEAGWTRKKVEHHAQSLGWRLIHPGVYVLSNAATTRRQLWLAAVLTQPGTVLSHGSAGACYGFYRFERRYEVVTRPGWGGPRRHGRLLVFRSRVLDGDATTHSGIPITTAARALVDLAPGLDEKQLGRTFRESIRLRCTTAPAVLVTARRHRGRPGVPALGALATRYYDVPYRRTRSDAEARALELLEDAGVPRPLVNVWIAGEEADLVWLKRRLIVELDGPQFHMFRDEDLRKQGKWERAGFEVRRVSTDAVYDSPAEFVALCAE